MKLLREMLDPTTVSLSTTERVVLAAVYAAPTPQMAYEVMIGAENAVSAKNMLMRYGFINVRDNSAQITEPGQQALIANNIIDDMGELTDEGKELQQQLEDIKSRYNESVEPFKFLKFVCR